MSADQAATTDASARLSQVFGKPAPDEPDPERDRCAMILATGYQCRLPAEQCSLVCHIHRRYLLQH